MAEYKVGQKVHVHRPLNERRWNRPDDDGFRSGTVTRVGRKYVYVVIEGRSVEGQYLIRDGWENTSYHGSAGQIMTDEQRAEFDRRGALAERYRALGLGSLISTLEETRHGYSCGTIEKVIDLLEADRAARS